MSESPRRNEWQVLGAVALIALGALILLDRLDLPFWNLAREAFDFALRFVWPIALIALGALLLVSVRREREAQEHYQATGEVHEHTTHRLYRSRRDRMIAGVLGGVARYLGVDSTWVRIIFVVLAVMSGFGPGLLLYLIALVLIPEEPREGVYQANWPERPAPDVWTRSGSGTETVQTPPPPPPPASEAPPAPPVPPAPEPPAPPTGEQD